MALGLVLIAASQNAHAYLDPGTGSILMQSILAGIAVAIGVVRAYWFRIRAFFGAGNDEPAQSVPTGDGSPQDSTNGK